MSVVNKNFEKDNFLTQQLARDSRRFIRLPWDELEVKICHSLYAQHPHPIEESKLQYAIIGEYTNDDFRSVIHDLQRRGIVKEVKLGDKKMYTLTSEFVTVMITL